jgi:hypothetical protein
MQLAFSRQPVHSAILSFVAPETQRLVIAYVLRILLTSRISYYVLSSYPESYFDDGSSAFTYTILSPAFPAIGWHDGLASTCVSFRV